MEIYITNLQQLIEYEIAESYLDSSYAAANEYAEYEEQCFQDDYLDWYLSISDNGECVR